MIRTALIYALALAWYATLAHAEPINGNLSTVDVVPSDKPGAFAAVVFHNATEPPLGHHVIMSIEYDGVPVTMEFIMGIGTRPDRMSVIVPEGYIAVPDQVTVNEGQSGTVTIYRVEGLGV